MREGEGEPCKNKHEKRTNDNRELTARNGVARVRGSRYQPQFTPKQREGRRVKIKKEHEETGMDYWDSRGPDPNDSGRRTVNRQRVRRLHKPFPRSV